MKQRLRQDVTLVISGERLSAEKDVMSLFYYCTNLSLLLVLASKGREAGHQRQHDVASPSVVASTPSLAKHD